jgi:hypothetical protein
MGLYFAGTFSNISKRTAASTDIGMSSRTRQVYYFNANRHSAVGVNKENPDGKCQRRVRYQDGMLGAR